MFLKYNLCILIQIAIKIVTTDPVGVRSSITGNTADFVTAADFSGELMNCMPLIYIPDTAIQFSRANQIPGPIA